MNADSGFDSENLRQKLEREEIAGKIKTNSRNGKTVDHDHYFDEKLYERRFKIEQANAWPDGFKALLIRFGTLDVTWKNLHFLGVFIKTDQEIKKFKRLRYQYLQKRANYYKNKDLRAFKATY